MRNAVAQMGTRGDAGPAITIDDGAPVVALHGDEKMAVVTIRRGGAQERIDTCAMFVMVGAMPTTGWFAGLVRLDEKGFVVPGADVQAASPYAASCPGVFAVGEVRAGSSKRVAAWVEEGSVVISRGGISTGGTRFPGALNK